MDRKITLHIVDRSTRCRAALARLALGLGHHAEVYSDIEEMLFRPPREGLVLLRDDPALYGLQAIIDSLSEGGICLPVLAMDTAPETGRVVDAMKAGALDYLSLPVDEKYLARVLAGIAEEAAAYSRAKRRMIEARSRISSLSNRERQVLDCLSRGGSNKAIARKLEISPRTVEIHRANMMAKLGASHPVDAVRLQLEAGSEDDFGAP